jgi:hypothetical protein
MPEKNRSSRTKGVPHHPLVEALASDPNQPPKPATRLFGYPGPAADGNSTRLWLDEGLSSYVDVPDEAIHHYRTLDNDEGTLLWVDPAATLTHSAPRAQEVQAEFLGGAIAQRNLAEAPSKEGLEFSPSFPFWECQSQLAPCQSWPLVCGHYPWYEFDSPPGGGVPPVSRGIVCQSLSVPCPTQGPPCEPFHSRLGICISKSFPCPEKFQSAPGACRTEPWGGGISPVVNPVGPFRPQQ